ncbi:GIY-YIG nuclease family protein [Epilithonimonas pallida]|uniref:GIY-YIG catalytic domain-containing protein n=1 Tax=Epilithonimonas pallida TaxID=373671 RepID=A0ABY1R1A8_9FLAO|nr:GIY-YIG nuclease family protein [Epilithonimonas pallida]SMP92001.1 GIY-YIG catalytic domain-containing protein [Epilithonimonas pallida]
MAFGKTIKIFLIDGDPNGTMSCELSNWTGKAYKIPRIKIKECIDRKDLMSTGIYLLLGKNADNKDLVYIGEAENVFTRLNQHLSSKDFWNEAIVFTSKDENLNKAHIKYLENRLHETATKTKRYILENGCIPTQSSISESDRAEMEEFLNYIFILVNTLGHKVFEDKREQSSSSTDKQLLYISATRGCEAIGEQTSEGFLVLKGSKMAASHTPSLSGTLKNLREELVRKGIIIDNEFMEDFIFSSPSYAAAVVMGRSANGLTEWKTSDGRILKSIETL